MAEVSGGSICNLGFLGLASLLAIACGDDGDSGARTDADTTIATIDAAPADASEQTRFVASWTLAGGCLTGDEVELEVSSASDGRVTLNRFPCAAASGTSDHVGAGSFDMQLRVIDTALEMQPDAGVGSVDAGPTDPTPGPLVAISDGLTGVMSVLNTDTPVAFAFPSNTATIASTWSFTNGNQQESCGEVGAVNVELEYERVGGAVERTIALPCTDLGETTPALPTGVYMLRANAVNGAAVSVRPELLSQVLLFVGNQEASATLTFAPAP